MEYYFWTFLRHALVPEIFHLVTTFKFTSLTVSYNISKLLPWIFSVIPCREVNIFTVKTRIMIKWKDVIAPKNENSMKTV